MGLSKTTAWHMYCTRDSPSEQTFMTLKEKKKNFCVPQKKEIRKKILCVCVHTVMAKNIGTLGKYDQRKLWKLICIVNPFDL